MVSVSVFSPAKPGQVKKAIDAFLNQSKTRSRRECHARDEFGHIPVEYFTAFGNIPVGRNNVKHEFGSILAEKAMQIGKGSSKTVLKRSSGVNGFLKTVSVSMFTWPGLSTQIWEKRKNGHRESHSG